MKVLYIDIDGANIIQPSDEIEVFSHKLINDYFFFIGEKIAREYADAVESLIGLVAKFEKEKESSLFTKQWEELKPYLFGENPQGVHRITLPTEYLTWLRYHTDEVCRTIYNKYYKDMQSVNLEIDIKELYDDVMIPLVDSVCRYLDRNADKGFTHFGFDEGVAENSLVCGRVVEKTKKQQFSITQHYDKRGNDYHKKGVTLNIEGCTLKMVHIPGDENISGFYVSETPITIQQCKALCPVECTDVIEDIEYWEEDIKREYNDFTIASAVTVEFVLNFLKAIKYPYKLPSREQWLHFAENYYERVKWCVDNEYSGISYEAIDWEMTGYNSYGIYCLLGIVYDENHKRFVKGNNFRKGQMRDNIAFRLVCSEWDIYNLK